MVRDAALFRFVSDWLRSLPVIPSVDMVKSKSLRKIERFSGKDPKIFVLACGHLQCTASEISTMVNIRAACSISLNLHLNAVTKRTKMVVI